MDPIKERDDILKQLHELRASHDILARPFPPNLDPRHYRQAYSRLMEVKSLMRKLQSQLHRLGMGDKAPSSQQKRWER